MSSTASGQMLATLLCAGLAVAACSSNKQGDPCDTNGAGDCPSDGRALYCEAGVWNEYPCPGPDGCQLAGSSSDQKATCDQSGAAEGTACPLVREGRFSCSTGAAALLLCQNRVLTLFATCTSGRTCQTDRDTLLCR